MYKQRVGTYLPVAKRIVSNEKLSRCISDNLNPHRSTPRRECQAARPGSQTSLIVGVIVVVIIVVIVIVIVIVIGLILVYMYYDIIVYIIHQLSYENAKKEPFDGVVFVIYIYIYIYIIREIIQ